MANIEVYLTDPEGNSVSVVDFIDAPQVFHFPTVTETIEFLVSVIGSEGFRFDDDGNSIPSVIADFQTFEDGFDLTHDFKAVVHRLNLSIN